MATEGILEPAHQEQGGWGPGDKQDTPQDGGGDQELTKVQLGSGYGVLTGQRQWCQPPNETVAFTDSFPENSSVQRRKDGSQKTVSEELGEMSISHHPRSWFHRRECRWYARVGVRVSWRTAMYIKGIECLRSARIKWNYWFPFRML